MASTAPFNSSVKKCSRNPAHDSTPLIPLTFTSLGFTRACSGRRVQSPWHVKSQFLRQVVTVINIVMFSNTINVLTRQQDRPQRKTQKFIGSIQQKIRFIFLLCKSITPSAMTFVNTGGRWNGGRTASSSTQSTNLFPSNPHTNFRKLHSRATPGTSPALHNWTQPLSSLVSTQHYQFM